MPQLIDFEGQQHEFPDDFTPADIQRALSSLPRAPQLADLPAPQPIHVQGPDCQSACKFDPSSASNFDPFVRRALLVALVSSELAGIAEARRARVA